MSSTDSYQEFQERIVAARSTGIPLIITGGNTKSFYGRTTEAHEKLDTSPCCGIIFYEPSELVITARAGTRLAEIEKTLAQQQQMLAFEPPAFGERATLGGVVACGLSGPRRPYTGAVRDFVLGVKCLNGKGEILTFGGQVMKNVAGYDASRLMTGAMGTLALLLEVSLKVLPRPEYEISLGKKSDFNLALEDMNVWAGKPLPLSGASYNGTRLNIRLSGTRVAVEAARKYLGMGESDSDLEYWQKLREHQLDYFQDDGRSLWRLSVPAMTPALALTGDWLIDWGGAQRWLKTDEAAEKIRTLTERAGGHATLFRNNNRQDEIFHPLPPALQELHKRLKQAFDPDRILNRDRMYPGL